MLNITELKVDFIARLEELIEKSRHGYYKDNQENRKLGRVGIPYGNKKGLIDEELISFNNRFNKELERQIKGKLPKEHIYKLGNPRSVLLNAGLRNLPIELSAERLENKSSKNYKSNHPFDLESIKNLPLALNNPIAIFDARKRNGNINILTDLKYEGVHFLVSINIRISDDQQKTEINSIRSIYPKDRINGIFEWVENGLLKWSNKKKILDFISSQWPNYIAGSNKVEDKERFLNLINRLESFKNPVLKKSLALLSSAKSTPQYNSEQDYLSSAIKIVTNFENDNTNKEYLTQMGNSSEELRKSFIEGLEELIEKSKKAQVGEIREWKGKKYQKQRSGKWKLLQKGKVREGEQIRHDTDYFGSNFTKFKGEPAAAVEFLLFKKEGQVKNVWNRKDIGEIDLVYGNSKFGLSHIYEKHKENKEYQDFKDAGELAVIIDKLLKEGKVIRTYKDKKGYYKKDISLGKHKIVIIESFVYDDDDNFSVKHWVLTAYDPTTKPGEKNIEKAVSEETAFEKKEPNYINSQQFLCNPRKDYLGEEQLHKAVYHPTILSLPKDTNNINKSQEFMQEFIEKSKKASPIGTEKTWKGKIYIKTEKGWRPKSKKKSQKEEESKESPSSNPDIENYAKKASEEQLIAATKDEKQSENIKVAAMKIFCLFYKKLCNNIANP